MKDQAKRQSMIVSSAKFAAPNFILANVLSLHSLSVSLLLPTEIQLDQMSFDPSHSHEKLEFFLLKFRNKKRKLISPLHIWVILKLNVTLTKNLFHCGFVWILNRAKNTVLKKSNAIWSSCSYNERIKTQVKIFKWK